VAATDSLHRTPLHEAHVTAGARMVDFGGWHMPVQYTGVLDEHRVVRTRAGLFDVSHMGEARVRGAQALEFLQHLTCNDVARLKPGSAHYTALTTPRGTFVDDLLVYKLEADDYLLILNAANTAKDLAWLQQHATPFDVEIKDESARWAQLALQGPQSTTILRRLTSAALDDLKYYRFTVDRVDDVECIVSRTGYTGEDGFELYAPSAHATKLWYALLGAGAEHGLVPIGLGARDTLRLEAKMALYGNDIDDSTTVLEADLAWIVKFKKGEFLGRDALARQADAGLERKLVGFEMRDRSIARKGYAAFRDTIEIGRVTSGSFAPFLQKNIGLAYLVIEHTEPGTQFEIEIRGRRASAGGAPAAEGSRDVPKRPTLQRRTRVDFRRR
jgi:aminomethyltransferase